MNKNVVTLAPTVRESSRLTVGSDLAEAEAQFGLLVQSLPGYAFFTLDHEGAVAAWSKSAERLTGWTAEEVAGRDFSIFFTAEDVGLGRPATELERARAAGRYETSGPRLRRDGSLFQAEAAITPLYAAGGELRGFVKMMRDATAQKTAEAELAASEARLRAVVETAVDAIIVIGEDGVVQSFNGAAERAFGYPASEVIGKNVNLLMPEPHRSSHDGYLARYRETGEAKIIGRGREVEARRKDGSTFPIELAIAEWWVGDKRSFTGIVRDITERKRAEEQMRLVMRELSHRTKNVLAVVQAMAWQTARACDDIRDFDKRFTSRLQALARSHDLLVKGDWRAVSLGDLVHAQLAPFLDNMEERLRVSGSDLSLKPMMAQELGLTLHELATNALKYGALSVPGGRIHVNWSLSGEHFLMSWRESGGPPVSPPLRKGFGHMVVQSMQSMESDVVLEFAPEGVIWRLTAPATLALSS